MSRFAVVPEYGVDFGSAVDYTLIDAGFSGSWTFANQSDVATCVISFNGTDANIVIPPNRAWANDKIEEELVYFKIRGGVASPGEMMLYTVSL